jgi:hypothetical protein
MSSQFQSCELELEQIFQEAFDNLSICAIDKDTNVDQNRSGVSLKRATSMPSRQSGVAGARCNSVPSRHSTSPSRCAKSVNGNGSGVEPRSATTDGADNGASHTCQREHGSVHNVDKVKKYIAASRRSNCSPNVIRAKVDSGAAVSVAPRKAFEGYKIHETYESQKGIEYTSASGHKIKDEGIRYPVVKTNRGDVRSLSMRVAEVSAPLISVFDMIHKNQRVVFDTEESYVEHKVAGQRIAIEWQGHNPVIDMTVLEPVDDDMEAPMLCDMDVESESVAQPSSSSSSFARQAPLP